MLGFSGEVTLLAKDYENSADPLCNKAAKDYLQLGISYEMTRFIYSDYLKSVVQLAELRRGFYCALCDGETSRQLGKFWRPASIYAKDRLYLSQDFCISLVENTVQSSYFTVAVLQRYANDLARLVDCATKEKNDIEFAVDPAAAAQTKNCYFFKDKFFFFYCEEYCELFHLSRADRAMENDIAQFQKFFTFIQKYRMEAFYHPHNNFLTADLANVEVALRENLEAVLRQPVLYQPVEKAAHPLETYASDVVIFGGIDPWESSANS